jgi:hypothetical protein
MQSIKVSRERMGGKYVYAVYAGEYIYRYGDFEGFFTRSNVTLLTGATARQ